MKDKKDKTKEMDVNAALGQTLAEESAIDVQSSEVQENFIALKESYDALNDKYLRLSAEFDNYRKRTSKERLDLVLTAGEDLIQGLLPVLDDFMLAQQAMEQAADMQVALEGVDLIFRKLYKYLESKGLKAIEAKGQVLDTDLHDAVTQFPAANESEKGKVVDVIQQGYTLNGKVIRYAKVVVGV